MNLKEIPEVLVFLILSSQASLDQGLSWIISPFSKSPLVIWARVCIILDPELYSSHIFLPPLISLGVSAF